MLAALLIPFVGALFMFILKDPVFAQKMGVISAKAQIGEQQIGSHILVEIC